MDVSKLSAQELAVLDAVCLEFESLLREGRTVSIDELVRRHGGQHADVLREELLAIETEIREENDISPPFGLTRNRSDDSTFPDADSPRRSDRTNSKFASEHVAPPTMTLRSPDQKNPANTNEASVLPVLGQNLGPYRLESKLGKGGMGVVYRATDTRLEREVAVKMLTFSGVRRQELIDRFEREARSVAALSHPNIIELFDVGVLGSIPYAVMEFLDGPTLAEYLDSNDLPTAQIREIGRQIAGALDVAHASGVIHRDLKPQNIMLVAAQNQQQRVKLLDFGLSRELPDENNLSSTDSSTTREGAILGTPGYMSPEQARGESASSPADMFALGCILFEAFYRKPAISGETVADRFAATLSELPRGESDRRKDDPELATLIEECLDADAEKRPTASEASQRLRELCTGYEKLDGVMAHRRSFLTALFGGVAGTLGVAFYYAPNRSRLSSISSLGVLSFDDYTSGNALSVTDTHKKPLGERDMTPGEKIAATLVNELSRIDQISVRPFRPLHATTVAEYQQIGKDLGVEALVAGEIRPATNRANDEIEVSLKIVSVKTGNQLWAETVTRPATDEMFQYASLAGEVARRIGQKLVPTSEKISPPSARHYNCLVDGKARACGDSIPGMKRALMCFEEAHKESPKYIEPLASIAITSMTLAAQSPDDDAGKFVEKAIKALQEARKIDPANDRVMLAEGMVAWQRLHRYEHAESLLKRLADKYPYKYEFLHQYGVLLTVMKDDTRAREHLSAAALLNSMSSLLRTDAARLEWFAGNPSPALVDAQRAASELICDHLANGLQVDIYEDQGSYSEAAEILGFEKTTLTKEAYFQKRGDTLRDLPYGPFGKVLNETIFAIRTGTRIDEAKLSELSAKPLPMFPLLLARHPAFESARNLENTSQYLPAR